MRESPDSLPLCVTWFDKATHPTSHLKNDQVNRLFFFGGGGTKVERKWCTNRKMGEVWGQDYEMQTLVYPGSQNIEAQAWMVKLLSAGCVNTVVAY